jgi:VanZ family protein
VKIRIRRNVTRTDGGGSQQPFFKRWALPRLIRLAAHLSLIFIFVASVSPPTARPTVGAGGIGFLEHAAAYAACSFLYKIAYYRLSVFTIIAALFGFASVLEAVQIFIPGRSASVIDASFSGLGASLGCLLSVIAQRIYRRWINYSDEGNG